MKDTPPTYEEACFSQENIPQEIQEQQSLLRNAVLMETTVIPMDPMLACPLGKISDF